MPIVPLVQKTVQEAPLPSARYSSSIQGVNTGAGISALATSLGKIVDQEVDKANTVALIDVQKKLDDWEATNAYDARTGFLAKKGKDAFDLPQQISQQYDKDIAGIRDSLGTVDQQMAFDKMVASRRDNIMRMAYTHERSQMEDYAKETVTAATTSAVNRAALNFNNPTIAEASINNAKAAQVAWGHVQGMPDEAIQNNVLSAESKARLAVLSRWADYDPKSAIDYFNTHQDKLTGEDLVHANTLMVPTQRRFKAMDVARSVLGDASPKVDQDGIINYVMNSLEGGDKVITDNNGAIAKFGINAKANPGVDVANLSSDDAKQYYYQRWSRLGIDKLSPEMRLPAMAFGTTNEKELPRLLDESGGDPGKFQQLAAQFYQELAVKNPEKYAASLPGWMNRLNNVSSQISYMRGELPNVYDLNNRIDGMTNDPQVATDAKEVVNKQVEAMRKARKDSQNAASDQAWKYKQQGLEVPPSVVARMDAKEATEMQTTAPTDPALYEQTRQQILAGLPVDLNSMKWRLGKKYDELVEMQGDPTKISNARKVDDVIDAAGQILLGKSKPQSEGDFQKIESFRRRVDLEIQAYQKTTGKTATGDIVQSLTDRMLLTARKNTFSSNVRLFEAKPGEQVEPGGIRSEGTHLLNGNPVSQNQVLDLIIKNLRDRNLAVNDNNVQNAYKKMLDAGLIQWTYDKVK